MEIDRQKIEQVLPHRDRALLLDRAEIGDEENRAAGYLLVTKEHCEGHFPGKPIMRGVDRIEMIVLVLGLAAYGKLPEGHLPYLISFGRARFPGKVFPGNEIRAEAFAAQISRRGIKGSGRAFVNDKLVAEVEEIVCLVGKVEE